jgi:hypothetical protein
MHHEQPTGKLQNNTSYAVVKYPGLHSRYLDASNTQFVDSGTSFYRYHKNILTKN